MNQKNTGDIFSRIVLVCSAATASIGILVMIGWVMGMRNLASFGSNYMPMAPGAALAAILLGGTWFLYASAPSHRLIKICTLACALFVSLVAILNIIQFFTGVHTGIEEILVHNVLAIDPRTYGAGPMSPIAAASFLLTCVAMVLLLLVPTRRAAGLSAGFASVVISVSLVTLLGYFYGTPQLYGGETRPLALPAGLALMFLGMGLIATAGPDHFPLRLLVGSSVRALLMRAFLLVILIVVLTEGILHNLFSQLKMNEALKEALSVLFYVVVTSFIVWQLSRVFGGAKDRAEAELKQAEEALRRAHDELEIRVKERTKELEEANKAIREQAALLDKAQDAIIVQDLEHRLIYLNKSAQRLYGFPADEATGKNADELLYKEESPNLISANKSVIEKGEWTGELRQQTKDGKEIIVESRWTLVRDIEGKPKSILIINTDITERKKLESQLLRAQRMESIGTLAGGIAHDLNNVLTPMMLSLQMLKQKFKDEQSQRLIDILERSTQRGANLVKQVMSFAQGTEGERAALQVSHLITEIERIAKETFPRSIEIRTNVQKDLFTICGDATQLHQVIMNLCLNARDAMPYGGILRIYAKNFLIDESYARMNPEARAGPYVVITVCDTGSGIPPEILDRIFEPFFTTKERGKGTGIGLSTVHSIVKGHGGFINVHSEVGEGTTFKVYLPAIKTVETQKAQVQQLEMPVGHGELILVVDDEDQISESTKVILETHGYRAITANDGAEATALYVQNRDEIKVVLMDMMMPVMDGQASIRALRKVNPQVKIIAVSGLAEKNKLAEIVDTQVHAFLIKPYTAQILLKTIYEVISAR